MMASSLRVAAEPRFSRMLTSSVVSWSQTTETKGVIEDRTVFKVGVAGIERLEVVENVHVEAGVTVGIHIGRLREQAVVKVEAVEVYPAESPLRPATG